MHKMCTRPIAMTSPPHHLGLAGEILMDESVGELKRRAELYRRIAAQLRDPAQADQLVSLARLCEQRLKGPSVRKTDPKA